MRIATAKIYTSTLPLGCHIMFYWDNSLLAYSYTTGGAAPVRCCYKCGNKNYCSCNSLKSQQPSIPRRYTDDGRVISNNCGNLTGSCDTFLFTFPADLRQIWNFNFPKVVCGNIVKVWWEIIHEFYWKFLSLSSGEKKWKSVKIWRSYPDELSGTLFWNAVCVYYIYIYIYIHTHVYGKNAAVPKISATCTALEAQRHPSTSIRR